MNDEPVNDAPVNADPDEHELSGLYALDALEGDDRVRYEAHLATCERCTREVAVFRETMAIVGAAVGDDLMVDLVATEPSLTDVSRPPTALRSRVLDGIGASTPTAEIVPLARRPRPGPPSRARLLVAAAAAAVVLMIGAVAAVRSRAEDPTDAAALLGELRARGAVTVPAGGTATGAAQLVLDAPGGRAVLVVDGLAAVDADRTYQAWTIDETQTVRAAPRFRPDASGRALVALTELPAGLTTVAVTVEPAAGSRQPTTPIVLSASVA